MENTTITAETTPIPVTKNSEHLRIQLCPFEPPREWLIIHGIKVVPEKEIQLGEIKHMDCKMCEINKSYQHHIDSPIFLAIHLSNG